MSRQLPEKPNLEFLKKQAKELLRRTQQGKLADAQLALSREYGFHSWADLKAHVQALTLSPAEALKVAVCDNNDAASVRDVLKQHPELRTIIDDPLPDYGFRPTGVIRSRAAQQSGGHRFAVKRGRQYPKANRLVGRWIWRAG